MFSAIEGLPSGAIGFVASHRITAGDRETVLEPTIDWALTSGRIKLLYVLEPDFGGYDHGCPFDDAVFGTRHFTDFEKIAFVADDGPFRRVVDAIAGLMPAAVRVFGVHDLETAKAWVAAEEPNEGLSAPIARQGLPEWLTRRVHAGSHS